MPECQQSWRVPNEEKQVLVLITDAFRSGH